MDSAVPHNAYIELFDRLDALTDRGFGAWCAQALGNEVAYAVNVDWYRAGAQIGEVLEETGTGAATERTRDELECFLGDYFTVRRRSASPEQALCGAAADDAEFHPRALTGSAAACLLFLEHGGCNPWGAPTNPAQGSIANDGTSEPDPELLRRQIGMLCLQYAVLEKESALLRSACARMGSYDQRGGVDPTTLAFIDRGDWDAFQPIVRNRNFAKTLRRIGTLLGAPGFSDASNAELPLAEPQPGSIPSAPKPASRKAGVEWVKYLAKRSFFTVIEDNVELLAGQAGTLPSHRIELARGGWLWKFTQGRAEDMTARRGLLAADDPTAWQQAGQLLARWMWECSTEATPGRTIRAIDDAALALATAAANDEHSVVEFRLLRQTLRRNLGKACWMFNWLQKKSGCTDRGVFVREQASYIVDHYLGPQLAAVLYGIAHGMELDRAGLGAAAAEQGFGVAQIAPPTGNAAMPAGLSRMLALEISIAPAGDRPIPGSEALWKTVPLDDCRVCHLGRDPHAPGAPEDGADAKDIILSSPDIGRQALDLRIRQDGSLRAIVHNPGGVWIEGRHIERGEQADLRPGEHIFIPGSDLSYVIVPRWQIVA
mgnify:FL=1